MKLTPHDILYFLNEKFEGVWLESRNFFDTDIPRIKLTDLTIAEAGYTLKCGTEKLRFRVGLSKAVFIVNHFKNKDRHFVYGFGDSPTEALLDLWTKLQSAVFIIRENDERTGLYALWKHTYWENIPKGKLAEYFAEGIIRTDIDTQRQRPV